VRIFVCARREFDGGRQSVEKLNPPAARRAERTSEVIDRLDRDTLPDDHGLERRGLYAGIARRFVRRRKRLAIGLLDVLSRDYAT
jgi:hypothetical protein